MSWSWNKIKIYDKLTNLTIFTDFDELSNCFLYTRSKVISFQKIPQILFTRDNR